MSVALLSTSACGAPDPDQRAADQLRASQEKHSAEQEKLAAEEQTRAAAEAAAEAGLAPREPNTNSPLPSATEPPEADQRSTAVSPKLISTGDRASFDRMAATLPGPSGIAVAPVGRGSTVEFVGNLRTGVAWSTSKVPVAMAAIAAGSGSSADLRAAITASDNAAAERLFSGLGGGSSAAAAATRQIRASGDASTAIEERRLRPEYTPFGQTLWSLPDQTRFASGMSCSSAGDDALELMRQTIPGQRWGLGTLGGRPALKGGWGPGRTPGQGDGWLERQFGVVTISGRQVAIALAVASSDHASGTQGLTRLARWAASHVSTNGINRSPRC